MYQVSFYVFITFPILKRERKEKNKKQSAKLKLTIAPLIIVYEHTCWSSIQPTFQTRISIIPTTSGPHFDSVCNATILLRIRSFRSSSVST